MISPAKASDPMTDTVAKLERRLKSWEEEMEIRREKLVQARDDFERAEAHVSELRSQLRDELKKAVTP
jgi:septal ring factor EnvC (AmiA/AmiB activator)